jgi:hypothetical protein
MRYNMHASVGRHSVLSSLPDWLYLRQGVVSTTLALFTGLHRDPTLRSRPTARPNFQAKVQSQRHCQHQPVDRDDETVYDQDSRFGRTRR